MPDLALVTWGAGVALTVVLAVPHLMPLHRVAPRAAARVWLLALSVRALVALGLAGLLLVVLPTTPPFQTMAGGTWHHVVPLVSNDIDLSLDPLAHATILLPTLAMLAYLAAFALLIVRLTASNRRHMARNGLGDGPQGSLVMADRGVYIALTGVGPKRVLVSAGALAAMDCAELRAGLAHEDGHRRLGHRTWALAAGALSSVARLLPGTNACERGLRLSLERQADEWAVRQTRDPLALASAICKAATAPVPRGALGVASSPAVLRLRQLTGAERTRSATCVERSVHGLTLGLLATVFVLAGRLTTLAAGEPGVISVAASCPF